MALIILRAYAVGPMAAQKQIHWVGVSGLEAERTGGVAGDKASRTGDLWKESQSILCNKDDCDDLLSLSHSTLARLGAEDRRR